MSNTFKIGQYYDPSFDSMPTEEISSNLESICYGVTEEDYTKNLSEQELAEKKSELAEVSIKIAALEEEKKKITDELKLKFKEPNTQKSYLLETIKHRSERVTGKLFKIDDQEAGIMYFFDIQGQCVHFRGITPSEKQFKLKNIKKASNE